MLVWKLWTVSARLFVVTAILSCVIKIRGLFKSTKWRHFENVKFEALSVWHESCLQLNLIIMTDFHSFTVNEDKLQN